MKGCDATKLLIPCCTTVLFFCRISLICGQLRLNSLFLCSSVRMLTLVVFDSLFKIGEILHKMDISLKNYRVEQLNQSFFANWTDGWDQFSLFTLTPEQFVCSSHPWFHCALWSAFGLPRILSFSNSNSRSLCISACWCSENNSRRRSPLCWCSPTLTLTTSIGIW